MRVCLAFLIVLLLFSCNRIEKSELIGVWVMTIDFEPYRGHTPEPYTRLVELTDSLFIFKNGYNSVISQPYTFFQDKIIFDNYILEDSIAHPYLSVLSTDSMILINAQDENPEIIEFKKLQNFDLEKKFDIHQPFSINTQEGYFGLGGKGTGKSIDQEELSEHLHQIIKFDFIKLDSLEWEKKFSEAYVDIPYWQLLSGSVKQNYLSYYLVLDEFCSLRIINESGKYQYFEFDHSLKPELYYYP